MPVPEILVASDSPSVRDEVKAALLDDDTTVREVEAGDRVLPEVQRKAPDLVILDQQIGSMGAMAVCSELRLEDAAGRAPRVPVLALLDRRADVFLAKRADAQGWVVKPLDPIRLRRAFTALLAGDTYHDESHRPPTIAAPSGG